MSNRKSCDSQCEQNNHEDEIKVCLFISRNKDNKEINGFHQRTQSFIITSDYSEKINDKFDYFVKSGVNGEMSRMYISVNKRSTEKVNRSLIHYLIDNPNIPLWKIQSKIASIAAKKENAIESKWKFDFDSHDKIIFKNFTIDLELFMGENIYEIYQTPNGFNVVVEHGFDTRKLLEKYKGTVELNRDDLVCTKWAIKKLSDYFDAHNFKLSEDELYKFLKETYGYDLKEEKHDI